MASSTIDHMVALIIFVLVVTLFINLFNQTNQTAISYQLHRDLATKCNDIIDNILLNPGIPSDWGTNNCTPTGFGLQDPNIGVNAFGLQDPEFTEYQLSPFSLLRLQYTTGVPIYYSKSNQTYYNVTRGFGQFLFVSRNEAINYSTTRRLLGINGTYGFQLTITPVVNVSVTEVQPANPLKLAVQVTGTGFPIANSLVSYCLLTVELPGRKEYPSYDLDYGSSYTNDEGSVSFEFANVTSQETSYAFIVYAHLCGIIGVGYYSRSKTHDQYIVPFVDNIEQGRILIAHSYDIHYYGPPVAEVSYNATFVMLSEDFTLREMPLENSTGKVGKVNYGWGKPYGVVNVPTHNPGILAITYRKSATEGGIVLVPWGLNAMGFSTTFGDDPFHRDWVATEIRLIMVNKIVYQAKLALWSLEGYQVVG